MVYDHLTCYFLSGTGNSYRAASWLAEAAKGQGTQTEMVPINEARPREDLRGGSRQLVGIYHPSHGLMPPWSMIKFLLGLPFGRGAHAVVVPTRGGIPVKRIVIPGGAGLAFLFPLVVLFLKGYRLRGALGIDMPINMLNLHGGLKEERAERVIAWGKTRHQRLVDAVLEGRSYLHPVNVLWELAWSVPFYFWPIAPVAYLLVGRVFMAKLMFADTSCKGCGTCARNCPSHAIKMVGSKPKTPFWTHHCEVCMRCMGYCKFRAVQASHLWLLPVTYVTSFITFSLIRDLSLELVGEQFPLMYPIPYLIDLLLTFFAVVLLYYLFFLLQKIKPILTMFTYTTFTKLYPRRYHEPHTTTREMNRRS